MYFDKGDNHIQFAHLPETELFLMNVILMSYAHQRTVLQSSSTQLVGLQ